MGLLTHSPFFWDEWLLPAQACAQAVWSRAKLCHPRLALNSWLFKKKKKIQVTLISVPTCLTGAVRSVPEYLRVQIGSVAKDFCGVQGQHLLL